MCRFTFWQHSIAAFSSAVSAIFSKLDPTQSMHTWWYPYNCPEELCSWTGSCFKVYNKCLAVSWFSLLEILFSSSFFFNASVEQIYTFLGFSYFTLALYAILSTMQLLCRGHCVESLQLHYFSLFLCFVFFHCVPWLFSPCSAYNCFLFSLYVKYLCNVSVEKC